MPVVDQGAAVHLRLTARMQEARDLPALSFVLCNELRALVEYRQAAIVGCGTAGRGTLLAHSGLVAVDADTPFALWIGEMVDALRPALIGLPPEAAMLAADAGSLPARLADGWSEWLPPHALLLPLRGPDAVLRAVLVLARESPWPEAVASPWETRRRVLPEASTIGSRKQVIARAQPGGKRRWRLEARKATSPKAAARRMEAADRRMREETRVIFFSVMAVRERGLVQPRQCQVDAVK
jgi:hypothetical protein